jgi:hypothetical protein
VRAASIELQGEPQARSLSGSNGDGRSEPTARPDAATDRPADLNVSNSLFVFVVGKKTRASDGSTSWVLPRWLEMDE